MMRIAVTGTHGCGKTTLVDDFVRAHPGYESVPEPYWLLAQDGLPFADGATAADLEQQLRQSCRLLLDMTGKDLIFDRCPLDFLAYLDVVSAAEGFEWLPDGRLLVQIDKALATLDLVAFVPLRQPDEIVVAIEHPRLRQQVDRRLKTMLRQDDLGLLASGPPVLDLFGTRQERMARLTAALH
nr:AAA family ATPase [uncultured Devosia sp.]